MNAKLITKCELIEIAGNMATAKVWDSLPDAPEPLDYNAVMAKINVLIIHHPEWYADGAGMTTVYDQMAVVMKCICDHFSAPARISREKALAVAIAAMEELYPGSGGVLMRDNVRIVDALLARIYDHTGEVNEKIEPPQTQEWPAQAPTKPPAESQDAGAALDAAVLSALVVAWDDAIGRSGGKIQNDGQTFGMLAVNLKRELRPYLCLPDAPARRAERAVAVGRFG